MTLEDTAALAEIVGSIAVLVSVIYLTFEVRRNTRSVRTGSAWNATIALAELCEGIAGNQPLADLIMRIHD